MALPSIQLRTESSRRGISHHEAGGGGEPEEDCGRLFSGKTLYVLAESRESSSFCK